MIGAAFSSGSGVPLATPFRDGRIDRDSFAALVEAQIAAGTDALVICGSTGENHALSFDERAALITDSVKLAAGRVAVIAGSGGESLVDTQALSRLAADAGADGLLVITPRGTAATQAGVAAYYSAVAQTVDIPVYLYNYPRRTLVDLQAETIERLVNDHPNIVGMKQTDPNQVLVTELRRRVGTQFRFFTGLEQLALATLAIGAAGMITGSGNVVPREIASLYRAVRDGQLAEARRLHDALYPLFVAILGAPSPAAAIKYLLRRNGTIATNEHRLPDMPPTPDAQRALDAVYEKLADAMLAAR